MWVRMKATTVQVIFSFNTKQFVIYMYKAHKPKDPG